jgi:hypothetical protein
MTVEQAVAIIQPTGVRIALEHRFAFDTGTILRLDNYAMINIFDDGRYYIQGENTEELIVAFCQVEAPWNPDTWSGEIPRSDRPPTPSASRHFNDAAGPTS